MARRRRHLLSLAALASVAIALGACGDSNSGAGRFATPDFRLITPPRYVGAEPIAVPTPGVEATMRKADVARLKPVLNGWAKAVREGRIADATSYFALPAIVSQPSTGPVEIRTKAIAKKFNDSFPCGAKLLAAHPDGRYIVGTFILTTVPGRTCTTPKALVKVGFVFGDRKRPNRFTEWWRVAEQPGAEVGPTQRPAAPIAGPRSFG
jgi:hypothetical protein